MPRCLADILRAYRLFMVTLALVRARRRARVLARAVVADGPPAVQAARSVR